MELESSGRGWLLYNGAGEKLLASEADSTHLCICVML